MKKILITIAITLLALVQNINATTSPITIVSDIAETEQSWSIKDVTLELKNNKTYAINNTYLSNWNLLKPYCSSIDETSEHNNNRSQREVAQEDSIYPMAIALIVILAILGMVVGMYVLVAIMAQRRNRNPAIWLLLSFIGTPFLICIILLAIGKNRMPGTMR